MERDNRKASSNAPTPLVSLLVVVFEAFADLRTLLDSLFALKDESVEIIVIDGGSHDGTALYLESCGDQIDFWASEPDEGVYHAMTKAIRQARGTFLLHLNAGDRLLCIPKEDLDAALREGIDVAAFRVHEDARTSFKPATGLKLRFTNTLHHQGTFFRRTVFLPYDLRYRVFADFDVNQRLLRAGARMKTFEAVVAEHRNDGISNQNSAVLEPEFFAVIRANQGAWALPFAYLLRKWHGLRRMTGI